MFSKMTPSDFCFLVLMPFFSRRHQHAEGRANLRKVSARVRAVPRPERACVRATKKKRRGRNYAPSSNFGAIERRRRKEGPPRPPQPPQPPQSASLSPLLSLSLLLLLLHLQLCFLRPGKMTHEKTGLNKRRRRDFSTEPNANRPCEGGAGS